MVVVTIEIWPLGNPKKRRLLGVAKIANDLTGDKKHGNYTVDLSHSGKYLEKGKGTWKSGKVKHHRRSLSVYHLVCKALQAALHLKFKEDKNKKALKILKDAVSNWEMRKPALITNEQTAGHRAEIDKLLNAIIIAKEELKSK